MACICWGILLQPTLSRAQRGASVNRQPEAPETWAKLHNNRPSGQSVSNLLYLRDIVRSSDTERGVTPKRGRGPSYTLGPLQTPCLGLVV